MSFDVHILPSSQAAEQWSLPKVEAAIQGVGAEIIFGGEAILTADGLEFDWWANDEPGAMASLRDLSADVPRLLFAVAVASASFITLDDRVFFRTPSTVRDPPESEDDDEWETDVEKDQAVAGVEVIYVANADELARELSCRYQAWSDYRDGIGSTSLSDTNQSSAPPEPTPSPPKPTPSKKAGFFARLFGR